jgi:integrase
MKRPLLLLPEDKLAKYINKYIVPQRAKVRKMILRTQKNKNGESKIYIEVSRYRYLSNDGKKYENKSKRISTNVWVKEANWSKKKEEVLKSDFDYSEKNRVINEMYSEILKYISSDDLDYKFSILNKTDLLKVEELFPSKKMLLGKYLTDYLVKYIEYRKGYSARGTWKEFITLKNRILNYELSISKKLAFTDINNSFSNDFYLWLNKSYTPGTIYKTYELLVTFMYHYWNLRDEQKIEMNDKFAQKGFKKGHKESNEPNPLSEEEYQLLLNKKFKTASLNRTKDRFLMQCTLGCRYSDLFTFTKANFKDDKLIYKPIKTRRKKSNTIHLPLQDDAKNLLKKYKFDTTGLYITNQKYNEALESLFKELKIEVRSTHNGRDTFITRAIDAGVNIPTLLKWVGQESYTQLKKYFAYSDKQGTLEMKKLEKK